MYQLSMVLSLTTVKTTIIMPRNRNTFAKVIMMKMIIAIIYEKTYVSLMIIVIKQYNGI